MLQRLRSEERADRCADEQHEYGRCEPAWLRSARTRRIVWLVEYVIDRTRPPVTPVSLR